jgi:flagellar basal-body rod protein FlgB
MVATKSRQHIIKQQVKPASGRLGLSFTLTGTGIAITMGAMISEVLFRKTSMPAVQKSLDAGMLRSKVIANNIANATVPGFMRTEVNFESELRKALDESKLKGARTDPKHMRIGRKDLSKVKPDPYVPNDPTLPGGVNNVDIDIENAKMAENQLLYNFGVRFTKERLNMLDSSIKSRSLTLHQ